MPYKTGTWGEQAKIRSEKRKEYFKNRILRLKEAGLYHPKKSYRKSKKRYLYEYEYKGKNSLGHSGEIEGLAVLTGSSHVGKPCDLIWEGKNIDVKTAKPTKAFNKPEHETYRWKFLLSTQKNIADLFLLICKDEESKTKYRLLIPNKQIEGNNISFSEETISKYKQYILTS